MSKRCKARRVARTQSQLSIDFKMVSVAIECSVVYEHGFLKERHVRIQLYAFIEKKHYNLCFSIYKRKHYNP